MTKTSLPQADNSRSELNRVLRQMKLAAVLGLGVLLALILFWDQKHESQTPQKPLAEPPLALNTYRRPLPDFKWTTSDGRSLERDQLLGKVTLISFWADWCWPCHQEMPYLAQLHNELPQDQYNVWLINLDEPGKARQQAQNYWRDSRFPGPFSSVDKAQISSVLAVEQLPYHVVVDPQGQVVWEGVGAYHWKAPGFQSALRPLLKAASAE